MAKTRKLYDPELVSCTIEATLFDELQRYAWQNGQSMEQVFREALTDFYEMRIGSPEDNEAMEEVMKKVKKAQAVQALPLATSDSPDLPN